VAEIDDGAVNNKAVFVAPAILPDDTRELLGLWLQANEGAKFWATVRDALRTPGAGHPDRGGGQLEGGLRPSRRLFPDPRSGPVSPALCATP